MSACLCRWGGAEGERCFFCGFAPAPPPPLPQHARGMDLSEEQRQTILRLVFANDGSAAASEPMRFPSASSPISISFYLFRLCLAVGEQGRRLFRPLLSAHQKRGGCAGNTVLLCILCPATICALDPCKGFAAHPPTSAGALLVPAALPSTSAAPWCPPAARCRLRQRLGGAAGRRGSRSSRRGQHGRGTAGVCGGPGGGRCGGGGNGGGGGGSSTRDGGCGSTRHGVSRDGRPPAEHVSPAQHSKHGSGIWGGG